MVTFVISIVIFILILGVLVLIHELGHYFAAKKAGIKVEEFGFGLPPKLFGIKKGETEYTLNWIPAGGFVRLLGEDSEEASKDPRSYANKPAHTRAFVIFAGVLMNLAFAVIVYTLILASNGFKADFNLLIDQRFPFGHKENQVFAAFVEEGSPAEAGGLRFADKILTMNGEKIDSRQELIGIVNENRGKQIQTEVENINEKEKRTLQLTPRVKTEENQGALGISLGEVASIEYTSVPEKILSGVLHSVNVTQYSMAVFGQLVQRSVETGSTDPIREGVSGPIGILAVVNNLVGAGESGWLKIFELLPLISLSLAIFNVLPIPALDGGRLFFVLVEMVTRRKVNATFERWVHTVGLPVLLILFFLIAYSDILKFFPR